MDLKEESKGGGKEVGMRWEGGGKEVERRNKVSELAKRSESKKRMLK